MLLELRRQGPVTVATRYSMNRYGFESSYAFAALSGRKHLNLAVQEHT